MDALLPSAWSTPTSSPVTSSTCSSNVSVFCVKSDSKNTFSPSTWSTVFFTPSMPFSPATWVTSSAANRADFRALAATSPTQLGAEAGASARSDALWPVTTHSKACACNGR
eukprot:297259-Pyramimonas_sp.AAC.1